jgi:hypothetical protein
VADITAEAKGKVFKIQSFVSELIFDAILGVGWLESNRAVWDFVKGCPIIAGRKYKLTSRDGMTIWARRATMKEDVYIPARCEFDLPMTAVCRVC